MNIGPVTLYGGRQVGGSSGSSPPALHQLEVKERSVSVTMVWPYFTVLSYILDRGRMICPASGGEKENKMSVCPALWSRARVSELARVPLNLVPKRMIPDEFVDLLIFS